MTPLPGLLRLGPSPACPGSGPQRLCVWRLRPLGGAWRGGQGLRDRSASRAGAHGQRPGSQEEARPRRRTSGARCGDPSRRQGSRTGCRTPAACSFPGENARSWEALGEARPGQSSLSAGALCYRAWAQSWSSAALVSVDFWGSQEGCQGPFRPSGRNRGLPLRRRGIDGSPLGSSVPGILQARILEWVAISFSRGSSQSRDRTGVFCVGRKILYH